MRERVMLIYISRKRLTPDHHLVLPQNSTNPNDVRWIRTELGEWDNGEKPYPQDTCVSDEENYVGFIFA